MRVSVTFYSPCQTWALSRRASPFAAGGKSLQNRPLRRVENIVIKASSKVAKAMCVRSDV